MNHTIKTLAEAWRVSQRTIRRLIKDGKLGFLQVGDRLSIRPIDIQNYEKTYARPAGRAKVKADHIFKSVI